MKLRNQLTTVLLTAGLATTPMVLADSPQKDFSSDQKAQIERIVHEYLINKPEILIQMTKLLQQQQTKSTQDKALSAIPENAEKLFDANLSPILGKKDGSITLVSFFDYQCGHCRRMEPTLNELPGKHENLRIVYKIFPIFGEDSEFASRIALASQKSGKFTEMHHSLMTTPPPLTKKKVLAAAKALGFDLKKLQTIATSAEVSAEIEANYELAKALGIQGTPSFVISNPTIPSTADSQKDKEAVFLPGAVDGETLDSMIDKFK